MRQARVRAVCYAVTILVASAAAMGGYAATTATSPGFQPAFVVTPATPTAGTAATLDDRSSTIPAGKTISYTSVQFGDGTPNPSAKQLTTFNHVWAATGTYTVFLTIALTDGEKTSTAQKITVGNGSGTPSPTPTPSGSPSASPTATSSPTASGSPSTSSTPSSSPSTSPTASPTASASSTSPSPSASPSATVPSPPGPLVDGLPSGLPAVRWHLTARPWQPLGITRSAYLDRVEKMATFWSQHLGANGAPVSPFNDAAKGYNPNPTFQYPDAVSTLVAAGRTTLATTGVKAEDYATTQYYNDTGGSKDNENFWLYPLVDAIGRFASSVTSSVLGTWQSRMSKMYGARAANNHQTYDMKGLWKQWLAGLISHATATNAISNDWTQTQQARWHAGWDSLYHDTSSNPDTLAVENVGRVNTLLLGTEGYDGPNASAMSSVAQKGTQTSLLLQNPAGEAPTGGRTDDHVWVDAGSQLAFELMAQHTADPWLAGQYQHAAELSFREQGLWDRGDGSFQVTKNWFDPTARVGYQTASNFGFYNGNQMMHTADAYNVRVKDVPENPAPAEIGGYAFALNDGFNQGFADAGGTMVQVALQGSTYTTLGDNWNALGIRRISRANWDLRLGPSDDHYDLTAGDGASFGPTWLESGKWVKLVQKAGKYAGTFKTLLATPALTYAQVVWAPTSGNSGPTFTQKLTITPDGVLSKTTSSAPAGSWGMTYPIMKDDGLHPTTQSISSTERLAQVSFTPGGDEQNYMLLNHNGDSLTPGNAIRSTYGNITPVQATTTDGENDTFVYPRNGTDPSAPTVRDSFAVTGDGYDSSIGAVHGTLYVGRTSAGGYGDRIDVNGDGQPDVTLSAKCDFTIQLSGGVITAIETDAPVTATVNGTAYSLAAYTPQTF